MLYLMGGNCQSTQKQIQNHLLEQQVCVVLVSTCTIYTFMYRDSTSSLPHCVACLG